LLSYALTDLGTFGGPHSGATAINAGGQVVGWSSTATSGAVHAFLYSGGAMADLNDLIPANSGITLGSSSLINDRGQIVAQGITTSGQYHAVLLTPILAAPSAPDLAASSDSGSSDTDNLTKATTLVFRGTAEAGSTVELFRDGATPLGKSPADGGGDWSLTVDSTSWADGTYAITAVATDAAGNVSAASDPLRLTIDRTAPTVTAMANPATLWPPNGQMVDVTVSSSLGDVLSGIDPNRASYAVADDYGQVQPTGTVTVGPDGTYAVTVRLMASRDGSDRDGRHYTITVSALDQAGNSGSAATLVVVPHDQPGGGKGAGAASAASQDGGPVTLAVPEVLSPLAPTTPESPGGPLVLRPGGTSARRLRPVWWWPPVGQDLN
jgi:probable HAF family extracellular repeat protein